MRATANLGEFELILLLAILRLGDEAYGVPLSRQLTLLRGKEVSSASVYAALDRLELKGLSRHVWANPAQNEEGERSDISV